MKKIVAIGDIHSKNIWKEIVNKNMDADRIIFMGDYFDCFENYETTIQANNFEDIVAFKKANPEKVILLFGNHDYHYLSFIDDQYSGFKPSSKPLYSSLLDAALKASELQMAYAEDGYLFTHAGVTKTWCKNNDIDLSNIVDSINDLFITKPRQFGFTPPDRISYSPYGDNVTQTPIWIRLTSLRNDKVDGWKQIVGHTVQKQFNEEQLNEPITCIDWLDYVRRYLVIENNVEHAVRI